MTTIDQARKDVHTAFASALATADTADPQALAVTETALWTQMLTMGRALITLYRARQAGRPRPVRYVHDGEEYEIAGRSTLTSPTRVSCS